MIAELRSTGAAIRLITDGDVAGVIHCAEAAITGIDMYMGSGGAPEGVLAAAALKCMGGQMYGKLLFRNDDETAVVVVVGCLRPVAFDSTQRQYPPMKSSHRRLEAWYGPTWYRRRRRSSWRILRKQRGRQEWRWKSET